MKQTLQIHRLPSILLYLGFSLFMSGCELACEGSSPPYLFDISVNPPSHQGPPGSNFIVTTTLMPPVDSDLSSDHAFYDWSEVPLQAYGAPSLTETKGGLGYNFKVAGSDPAVHMFEFPCVEGERSIVLTVAYEGVDHEIAEKKITVSVVCSDDFGPDAGVPSSYRADLEIAFSELDDLNTVIVGDPTVAEGIVFYRLQDRAGTDPTLNAYESPGAKSQMVPEGTYSILNLDLMTEPFVASEMLECTERKSLAVFSGLMQPTLGGTNIDRLLVAEPSGASPTLIAEQGADAPGEGARKFTSFRDPLVDGCGLAIFDADVDGSKSVWRQKLSDGTPTKVFENIVQSLPGGPAAWRLGGTSRAKYWPAQRRTVLWLEDVEDSSNSDSHSGVWEVSEGGVYSCIAYEGSGVGTCRTAAAGQVHPPSFSATSYGFAVGAVGQVQYVIDRQGVPIRFDALAIAPDLGAVGSFSHLPVVCSQDDKLYIPGVYQGPSDDSLTGVVLKTNGLSSEMVVRTDDLPGIDTTYGSLANVSISLTANCRLMLHAENSFVRGVWIQDPLGAWVKVLQTGDTLDLGGTTSIVDFVHVVSGGNGFDHRPQAIDSDGVMALRVVTTEGVGAVLTARLVGQ